MRKTRDNVAIWIMFTNDPLSRKALDSVYPLQLIVMYKAFVLPCPSNGISLSEKAIMLLTSWSTFSTIYCGRHKLYSTLSLSLRWGSKFSKRANIEIRAISLLSCSTTLYSLCLMNFKNFEASFSIINLFIMLGVTLGFFCLESLLQTLVGPFQLLLAHSISHFRSCLLYTKYFL